jgi:drug/metabolite transporter (DMT)-like permease
VAVGLALLAALAYGAADFYGGLASRRMPAATVVVLAQLFGMVVLGLAFPFVPSHFYQTDVLVGLGAGVCGALGIAALYAALAIGRMGVVSPITAVVGASVPVVWGFATGERPAAAAVAGVVLAFLAVGLVSTNEETRRISLREPGLGLALASGAGIGFLYVLLAHAHHDSGLSVLATSRLTSIPLLLAYALIRRERLRPPTNLLLSVAVAGVLDMAANLLYVLAARVGLLAIVAVLTSLYPASTVFLARIVLAEKLNRVQWLGVGCAFCGVLLIAL